MLFAILLISLFGPINLETFQAGPPIKRIEGFMGDFVGRVELTAHGKNEVYVLDSWQKVWVISDQLKITHVFGGKGQGPGELSPPIQSMTFQNGLLSIIHGMGNRLTAFDKEGIVVTDKKLLFHGDPPRLPLYLNNEIEITATMNFMNPEHLDFHVQQQGEPLKLFPLLDESEQDRVISYQFHLLGEYGLVCTTTSLQNTIYYLLFDTRSGELLDTSAKKLIDKPDPEMAALLEKHGPKSGHGSRVSVESITTSRTYGFIISEQTLRFGGFRIVRIYDPKTLAWRAMKIAFDQIEENNLGHLQPIKGKTWMAQNWDTHELLFFDLSE